MDYVSSLYFDTKTKSSAHLALDSEKKITELKKQRVQVEENIPQYLHLTKIMEAMEKQLSKIDEDIFREESEFMNSSRVLDIDKSEFRKFMNYCITHIEKFASDSENNEKIELIFRFIFQEKPTYEEIVSHTPKMYPIFALQSQLKNSPEGEFFNMT